MEEAGCGCLEKRRKERLEEKLKEGKNPDIPDVSYPIPPSVKKVIIYTSHDKGGIRVGASNHQLSAGFNVFCTCRLYKLQKAWGKAHHPKMLTILIGPTLFQSFIQISTVRRNTLFFCVYNHVHQCESPPPLEETVPSLKHLSFAGLVANGLRVNDTSAKWLSTNLPVTLFNDFPEVRIYNFSFSCEHEWFLGYNHSPVRFICNRPGGHGKI